MRVPGFYNARRCHLISELWFSIPICACRYTNHCYKLVACEEREEQSEDGQLEVVRYVTIKNPHNSAQVRAA